MTYFFLNIFLQLMRSYLFLSVLLLISSCTKVDDINTNKEFSIDIIIEGQGEVKTTYSSLQRNSLVKINAIPDAGYYFDYFEIFNQKIEEEEYSFYLNSDIQIKAVFSALPDLAEEIDIYEHKEVDKSPVFMIENGGKEAYLKDKTGKLLNSWSFESKLGNELKLIDQERVFGMFKPDQVEFSFGGYGGILREFNVNNDIIWEYEVNTSKELLHHDFQIMPNGNILALVWEKFTSEESKELGYKKDGPIYLEKIIEIEKSTKKIIWEWRSVDHLIQDYDSDAKNYGLIYENPKKIDINYVDSDDGDIMHANGLFYDPIKDLIYLSVNFYSEVWVIPHNYNTEETKSNIGDLLYRFGNPSTYKSNDERFFYNNHHPNLVTLDLDSTGNFIIYVNGYNTENSIIYEYSLPNVLPISVSNWSSIKPIWSYSNEDLFHGKISGAIRLSNGNTLICEGDFGYWEVNKEGKIVWKYNGNGKTFWRGYVY